MPFDFKKLQIEGLVLVEPKVFHDSRGFFMETYKESEFGAHGIAERFVQDNHSLSQKGVLRGLHFQHRPKAQGKLVSVIKGSVWDVAVDIRPDSSTYMKWCSVELTEENKKMLYIPPGFAHGFAALSDDVHLVYKCTSEYDANCDAGIRWNDTDIGVDWPISEPIVSDKDRELPFLKDIKLQ